LSNKSTNHERQSIGIAIVAAMMLLLLAGTILVPTQASALSKFNTNTDTSSIKQGIRNGVNVNQEHRDEHINQENICFRTHTCRQSDVGQNTLGNDNSITGFADQSDNIQQSAAVTPTTANKTTSTPTSNPTPIPTSNPTPTPTTATLTVIKIVSGNTTATAANFTIQVHGSNANPNTFAGSPTGVNVILNPGTFNVTETATPAFTTSFTGDCDGPIAAGQHLICTITNTPATCAECFTRILTKAQIDLFLFDTAATSIEQLCNFALNEKDTRDVLANEGVEQATINELIACLKAAGVVGS
jgi:hypothetical protein